MRVRKICTECKKLKLMLDFESSETSVDGKSEDCKGCVSEKEYKNNNKPLKTEVMSTLAEKRAAAKAAAIATPTVAETPAPKVAKEKAVKVAPVADIETVEAVDAEGNAPDTSGEPAPKLAKEKAPKVIKEKKEKVVKAKKQIEQIDLTTGEVIQVFLTVDLAAASVGKHTKYIDIAGKGNSKQAYGFGWRYEGLVVAEAVTETVEETVETVGEAAGETE